MKWTVYKHTSPNGKVYVGVTSRKPEYRWNHGNGYKQNAHFYNAILKYGWDNFEHEILYVGLDRESAFNLEKELISEHRSNDKDFGYNNSSGGEKSGVGSHWVQSAEHRHKISESLRGNKNCLGRVLTDEHKKKISEALKGRVGTNKGKTFTDTHKQKISQSRIGIPSVNRVAVWCEDLNLMFPSIHDASKQLGIDASSIAKCCKGKRTRAGGYQWRYYDAI